MIKPGLPAHLRTLSNNPGKRDPPRGKDNASRSIGSAFRIPDGTTREDDRKFVVFGESDRGVSSLPRRVLKEFVVMDPNASNAPIGLQSLFNEGPRVNIIAYGFVSAYKMEVDPDPEDDDELVAQPLLLTALRSIRVDYATGLELEVWVTTAYATYKLESPSVSYASTYAEALRRHHAIHCVLYRASFQMQLEKASLRTCIEDHARLDRQSPFKGIQWTNGQLAQLANGIATELEDFAWQSYDDDDVVQEFLSSPLIAPFLSPRASSVARASSAPRGRKLRKGEAKAPTAHMMPVSGALARELFKAPFKIHKPPGSLDELPDVLSDEEVRAFIRSQKAKKPGDWLQPSGRAAANGSIESLHIPGLGRFNVGDFALIAPFTEGEKAQPPHVADEACLSSNSISNDYGFVRIVEIYKSHNSLFVHGQVLRPACQTVLQELAHSCELVLEPRCYRFRVGGLVRPITVRVIGEDDEFQEPSDAKKSSFSFFLRHSHTADGSFLPLDSSSECSCFRSLATERQDDTPHLLRSSESNSVDVGLLWKGKVFKLHDYVYLAPAKGSLVYQIGQIAAIRQWEVEVEMLGRYEDLLRHDKTRNDYGPADLLYTTQLRRIVLVKDIMSHCHVRHSDTLLTKRERERWASIDGYIVGYQLDVSNPTATGEASVCALPLRSFRPTSGTTAETEEAEMDRIAAFRRSRPKCYDLFHGAGGLSMGFENAGWEIIGGVDLDPDASDTASSLHSRRIVRRHLAAKAYNMDARKLLKEMLKDAHGKHPTPGEVDLVLAGPPCQDYSGLNRFKSAHDAKKALVAVALSIVEYLQPRYAVVENVPLLLGTTLTMLDDNDDEILVKRAVHKYILRTFMAIGYNVRWQILSSAHYGAPQTRERLIYIAAKRGLPFPPTFVPTHASDPLTTTISNLPRIERKSLSFRGAPHYPIYVKDAISDLPEFDWDLPPEEERVCRLTDSMVKQYQHRRNLGIPSFTTEDASNEDVLQARGFGTAYATDPQNEFQRRLRGRYNGPPLQHITKFFASVNVERVHHIGTGPNADHRSLPPILQLPGLNSVWSASAQRHNYFPGLYGRVQLDSQFNTIVTEIKPSNKQGRVLHPTQMRVLSVRECARAQCFPDDMAFSSSNNDPVDMHRQIGNAVPVALSEAIARAIRAAIMSIAGRSDNSSMEDSD